MFTGIIDHCGKIIEWDALDASVRCVIETQFKELKLGESISIDGICLTVTDIKTNSFACDISPETLAVTRAKEFKVGTLVNLERAMCLSDRLGGHFVTGHVDQVARVLSKQDLGDYVELCFELTDFSMRKWFVSKGSVAVNGVSLTINSVTNSTFSVMLIPHTLKLTNLHQLVQGSLANIECDYLAKLVSEQVKQYSE